MGLSEIIAGHVDSVFLKTAGPARAITLLNAEPTTVNALIRLDPIDVDPNGDEPAEITGTIWVSAADAVTVRTTPKATIEDHTFHVNGDGTAVDGLVPFTIVRDTDAGSHTNMFDLNEDQATRR